MSTAAIRHFAAGKADRPGLRQDEAEKLAKARGWSIAVDGKGWRRIVASPRPKQILEARVIELLVSQDSHSARAEVQHL